MNVPDYVDLNDLLNTEAAADALEAMGLRREVTTLEKLRWCGGGPKFIRAGRSIIYRRSDLAAWVQAKLEPPVGSTSEYPEREAKTGGEVAA